MSFCEYFKDKISDFLEGALSKEENLKMEEHSAGCLECSSILNRTKELNYRLRNLEQVNTSNSFEAVLRSSIRKELEHESESFIDKLAVYFPMNKKQAFSFSLAALLFIAYVSYDIYHHFGSDKQFDNSIVQTQTQELQTIIPDREPIVRVQDKGKEQIYFILEQVNEQDILKQKGWNHSENIQLLEQHYNQPTNVAGGGTLQTNLQQVSF